MILPRLRALANGSILLLHTLILRSLKCGFKNKEVTETVINNHYHRNSHLGSNDHCNNNYQISYGCNKSNYYSSY